MPKFEYFCFTLFILFLKNVKCNLCEKNEENYSLNKTITSSSVLQLNFKLMDPKYAIDGIVSTSPFNDIFEPQCSRCDDLDMACSYTLDLQRSNYVTNITIIVGEPYNKETLNALNFSLSSSTKKSKGNFRIQLHHHFQTSTNQRVQFEMNEDVDRFFTIYFHSKNFLCEIIVCGPDAKNETGRFHSSEDRNSYKTNHPIATAEKQVTDTEVEIIKSSVLICVKCKDLFFRGYGTTDHALDCSMPGDSSGSMSSLCNVKKSTSVPECLADPNYKPKIITENNIYYEEAWDLRMARLGIDIAKLNNAFNEISTVKENPSEPTNMTRSCIEPAANHDNQESTIIRMTSSAIADSVIANNPVYTFKQYVPGSNSASASPAKIRANQLNDIYATTCRKSIDNDNTLERRIGNMATLRPNSHRGLLLNNNCYELASSELVNAILDRDREFLQSRIYSNNAPSAFKPLVPGSKPRLPYQAPICNNQCYNSVLIPPLNSPTILSHGYSRQKSAPTDTSDHQMKMLYSDTDSQTKSLHFKSSRRSLKKSYDISNISQQIPTITTNTMWTGKSRFPDQIIHDSNRIVSKAMSKSMVADDSKLSDNYIKHLKGQEIAGNFIKQSHRPECHIQRTEDRYHMGFHDSRLDMIADSNRPLEEHLWFHPHLSRAGAEQLLSKYPEGSFLVRRSESSINEYSLSIRYKQKWLHMKISRDQDGQFVLGQYSQPYPSIPIMIRHYSCSFLPVKGANLISLQQPVFRH